MDGLGCSVIQTAAQSPDGRIWIASDHGIAIRQLGRSGWDNHPWHFPVGRLIPQQIIVDSSGGIWVSIGPYLAPDGNGGSVGVAGHLRRWSRSGWEVFARSD